MAVTQPLKGGSNKIYSVINNFNKGIDRKTADDVASDASFKELVNLFNANDGTLSKRPGVYDSYLADFIGDIVNGNYNEDNISFSSNKFDESFEDVLPRLQDFYNTIIVGDPKRSETNENVVAFFKKIVGFQITKQKNFFRLLQVYKDIFNYVPDEESEELPESFKKLEGVEDFEFSCIIVAGAERVQGTSSGGLYITRLTFKGDVEANLGSLYNVEVEVDSVDCISSFGVGSSNSRALRWGVNNTLLEHPLDMVSYGGYVYMPTGLNCLIRIDQNPETKTTHETYTNETSIFQVIGGPDDENLYKPTPIELNRVGFNILANNPLRLYDISGATGKIRGVFYTVRKEVNGEIIEQPVQQIPYNSKFYIHILFTGEGLTPTSIKYRPDNGETDPEKNAYQDLPGVYESDVAPCIFECSGIDATDNFEIQIILGEDEFLSYISTGSVIIPETGLINEVNDLIFSSTRLKVINSQLMLYGGHGYLFFSDFEVFNYFPNFYNIYVANESLNETVVSVNYFRQYYAVFTDRRIKKLTGSTTDDFAIYPLNDYIGCANGYTVKALGNNLFFLGNDGIYRLKQGYLGEGTENVEKMDFVLNDELNISNVNQAFVMNGNYVVIKNDNMTWIVYNLENDAFYEFNLESEIPHYYTGGSLDENILKLQPPFEFGFETSLYDENGNFIMIPMADYERSESIWGAHKRKFMTFRFADLDYLDVDKKHKDGYGFTSSLETHDLHMGYPTNTKKFKDIYIKMLNNSGHAIPLYVTIYVDDRVVISPENYVIKHDVASNTFYYVKVTESNEQLDVSKVLGEFTLGEDVLGNKTIQQIKFRIADSGRSIKIKLSDGYNDTSSLDLDDGGVPERKRNVYDFSILSIGIVYKVKKVKEG